MLNVPFLEHAIMSTPTLDIHGPDALYIYSKSVLINSLVIIFDP